MKGVGDLELAQSQAELRAAQYDAGEYDTLLGGFLRAEAARGDPRALALVYEAWREIKKEAET